MAYMLARDALNGKEGRAFVTINGRQIELFNCKNVKLEYSVESSDFKVVGTRKVQKKTTGITYTGNMTIVYGTDEFKRLVRDYIKTGAPPFFDLQVTNLDPATSVGAQTAVARDCLINSGVFAQLDSDTDFLQEDIGFSYTDIDFLDTFHDPERLGG